VYDLVLLAPFRGAQRMVASKCHCVASACKTILVPSSLCALKDKATVANRKHRSKKKIRDENEIGKNHNMVAI
jgi:hypothetical protein